jgi:septum site-determining protein MinC
MNDIVLLKGNQHGLSVFINEDSSFEQIKDELINKLEGARNFFGANKVTLSFNGKSLDDNQQKTLIDLFSEHSDLEVLCVVDEESEIENLRETITNELRSTVVDEVSDIIKKDYVNVINEIKHKVEILEQEKMKLLNDIKDFEDTKKVSSKIQLDIKDEVKFHYATLRSGQQVIHNHSVVIMGDVNNGARVEAGGSVIIIGKLKGVVNAGLNGTDNAYIVALDMKPVQLRINQTLGRASDEMMNDSSNTEPKIAFVEDGMIAIETIDNKVLKEIRGN